MILSGKCLLVESRGQEDAGHAGGCGVLNVLLIPKSAAGPDLQGGLAQVHGVAKSESGWARLAADGVQVEDDDLVEIQSGEGV